MSERLSERVEALFIRILSDSLRGEASPAASELAGEEEAAALLSLAQRQMVLPLVLEACRDSRTVLELPMLPEIRVRACASVAHQMVYDRQTRELLCAAYEAGFTPLVLKGVMCRRIYPAGSLRPSSDEDFYLRPEEFQGFCRFMTEQGFSRADDGPADAKEPGERCYSSEKTGLCVELHPCFFSKEKAFARVETALSDAYERRTWYDCDGRVCDTVASLLRARKPRNDGKRTASLFQDKLCLSLSPTDHLFYLLAHAYKHFLYSGFGIRQVLDIGLWAGNYDLELDWTSLLRTLERCSMNGFASAVLRLARDCFGIGIRLPEKLAADETPLEPMLNDLLDAGIYGSSELSRLHSAPILLERASEGEDRSPARQLFPRAKALESRYPFLRERPWLLPWAWLKRDCAYVKETLTRRDSKMMRTLRIAEERTELARLYGVLPGKKQ